jgi:hypothetical protein
VFTAIAYVLLKEIPRRMKQVAHCPSVEIIYLSSVP